MLPVELVQFALAKFLTLLIAASAAESLVQPTHKFKLS
jgi:hypothetical protein